MKLLKEKEEVRPFATELGSMHFRETGRNAMLILFYINFSIDIYQLALCLYSARSCDIL